MCAPNKNRSLFSYKIQLNQCQFIRKINLLVLVLRFRIKNRRRRQVSLVSRIFSWTTLIQSRTKKIINLIHVFFLIFVMYIRDSLFRMRRYQLGSARNNGSYVYRQNNTFPKTFSYSSRQSFFKEPDYIFTHLVKQLLAHVGKPVFDSHVGINICKIFGGASVRKRSQD